ncbi:MAG: methionyl-tRNA formyltransferase [Buchnera aphidicola (Periphyllus lyropictus)]|uniref:methionyl-tRNA formyltransferase n=1 Tax=Buchnera aphidicola TaxID=9 RepID=UPI001ECFAA52|nr:methionyl-tRNA formyltransferase [Buchnera aphidicola]NIH16500.1 methionyl-tRNA formyltransferase [Buchnera aphidicola (Periphyllus lyropictus)]USS94785.1 methionyl-tRNA formyltransferase [Buchnera aphidicola (Periphyllus lyropictus)]
MKKLKKIKIIFAGNEKFSKEHLNELILNNLNVITIFTKPDKRSGRGKKIKFSKVKKLAIKKKIKFLQPKNLNSKKTFNYIKNINPDIMIIVSYGLIIPKKIIKIFPLGCINIHTSLLPKFRGPSPIQSVILLGKKKTGITIIQINKKIDEGDILYQKKILINKKDTYKSLKKKLCFEGKKCLILCLKKIIKNKIIKIKQDNKKSTYTKKIKKKDGLINWNNSASTIEKKIRAFNPWPGTFFFIKKIMIKIWKAEIIKLKKKIKPGIIFKVNKNGIIISTKKNFINIKEIQISGKKKNKVNIILNAYKNLFNLNKKLN